MKTISKKNPKRIHNLFLVLPLALLIATACNTSDREKSGQEEERSKEYKDVKKELSEVITMEKNRLKNDVDSLITEFNKHVIELETEIEDGQKKLDAEKRQLLNELKAKRDSLNVRLEELETRTEKNWEEFKTEFNREMNQFSKSVENFFRENE